MSFMETLRGYAKGGKRVKASLRNGQKTKIPKTKKKKKVTAMESVEGNRPSYWD